MKYQVEITKIDIYVVEAETEEEARELVVNGCCDTIVEDEVFNINVEKVI